MMDDVHMSLSVVLNGVRAEETSLVDTVDGVAIEALALVEKAVVDFTKERTILCFRWLPRNIPVYFIYCLLLSVSNSFEMFATSDFIFNNPNGANADQVQLFSFSNCFLR